MSAPSLTAALAPLQQQVEREDVWQLPEYVQLTPPAWISLPRILAVGIAVLLALEFARVAGALELAIALGAVVLVTGVVLRWGRRRSLPLGAGSLRAEPGRGCRIDVVQRQVSTQGVQPPRQWVLDVPQEWSVGVVAFTDRPRMRYGWRIELRHLRKGPVVSLCSVLHLGHTVAQPEAVDALAQAMAARLGARCTAQPSVSGKHRQ